MLVAGSYSEDTDDLTVGLLDFDSMKWTTAQVKDPRQRARLETPTRRAAVSGGLFVDETTFGGSSLSSSTFSSRLPMLVLFGGFELSGRRCFNDLYTLPL